MKQLFEDNNFLQLKHTAGEGIRTEQEAVNNSSVVITVDGMFLAVLSFCVPFDLLKLICLCPKNKYTWNLDKLLLPKHF